MTYLAFHLIFTLPPILALVLTLPRPLAGLGNRRARWGLPLISLMAFIYTTPWDNYLIYHGVWSYGSERVLATVGYVPVEEYAFFVLQPLLTGLTLYQFLGRRDVPPHQPHPGARRTGTILFLALSITGVLLITSGWERGRYLGLILAWAGPVLTGLWFWGGSLAWQMRRLFLSALLFPTLYLWCADAIALRLRIWHIADGTSLGISLLGLPLEEAVFFFMSNLMVVLGLLLFLYPKRATV